jgi:hypothetical protein
MMTPDQKILAIQHLLPGAQLTFLGDELRWHDSRPQPTEAEIAAALPLAERAQQEAIAQEQRAAAYRAESDPLFFKAQRGEATMEEWQARVAEIRQRYPEPA